MTPETLRGKVVLLVVGGIIGLSVLLYALIGALLILHVVKTGSLAGSQVPGELWLGAGVLAGSLTTLLANSKMGNESSTPQPVTTVPGESLAVHEASPEPPPVQDPDAKPWQLEEDTQPVVVESRRSRRLRGSDPQNQGDY